MCGIIALLPLSEGDVFGIRHSSFSSCLVLIKFFVHFVFPTSQYR